MMKNDAILNAIFTSIYAPVAVYHVTGGGDDPVDLIYDRVNRAYLELNDFAQEEIIGRRYTEVCRDETEEPWMKCMLKVAETGTADCCEGMCVRRTGYYVSLLAFSPVAGRVVAIVRDLSEWHKSRLSLIEKQELLQKLTTRLTLAEERTRRDIANTLHDGVGFEMVTMLNSLRSLREKTEGRDAKELLADNISRMEKLIENTRSFTFEISPPLLYEAGLDATLEACCGHMFGTNGVKCDFRSEGTEIRIAEDTKVLLYQMAHEILVNVAKHAKARNVLVMTRWGAKKVQLFVRDDGVGFDQSGDNLPSTTSGMGLFSIRERMSAIGGQFNVISEPGAGTTVSLIAPIRPAVR